MLILRCFAGSSSCASFLNAVLSQDCLYSVSCLINLYANDFVFIFNYVLCFNNLWLLFWASFHNNTNAYFRCSMWLSKWYDKCHVENRPLNFLFPGLHPHLFYLISWAFQLFGPKFSPLFIQFTCKPHPFQF